METIVTFTFRLIVNGTPYQFQVNATTREEALKRLIKDLEAVVVQLNTPDL